MPVTATGPEVLDLFSCHVEYFFWPPYRGASRHPSLYLSLLLALS